MCAVLSQVHLQSLDRLLLELSPLSYIVPTPVDVSHSSQGKPTNHELNHRPTFVMTSPPGSTVPLFFPAWRAAVESRARASCSQHIVTLYAPVLTTCANCRQN